jgi:hypothetical protein
MTRIWTSGSGPCRREPAGADVQRNGGSPRTLTPWFLLLSVAMVVGLSSALGVASSGGGVGEASTPLVVAPITGFGGYHVVVPVRSIGAQWQVPRLLGTSRTGSAATWIGAQSHSDESVFIQIGTIEQMWRPGTVPGGSSRSGPGIPSYLAFWSDAGHHFHPVILGSVAPGSTVSTRMVRSASSWLLTMRVGSRWLAHDLPVPAATGGPYDQAEWLQEDPPTSLATSTDGAYPELSPLTMRHLQVNGSEPRLPVTDGQALSNQHGTFMVPTPMEHGSFSLMPVTGAAQQYLADATTYDASATAFAISWNSWAQESSDVRVLSVERQIRAMSTMVDELRAQTWPAGSQSMVDLLAAATQQTAGGLARWIAAGDTATRPVIESTSSPTSYAEQLRSSLGLPPVR